MMRGRLILILAVVMGFGESCKKDDSSSNPNGLYQDEYRFYAKAKVNGLPIDFNAGQSNYGLETDYSIEDSVVVMSGRLNKENEPTKSALYLKIRSSEKVKGQNSFRVEKSIYPGLFSYRDKSGHGIVPGSYELKFLGDTSYSQLLYRWLFEDGSTSTFLSPPPITLTVQDYDPFKVKLITDYYGCESVITHWINLQKDCDATIEVSGINTYGFKVSAITRQGNILNVDWILDGEEVNPDFTGRISTSLYGKHTLRAEMYFEEGCTRIVERTFDASSGVPCMTDFWYEKTKATNFDTQQLGAVELEYYDENGKKFTSYYSGIDGEFEIVSLSPYLENEKGQKTTRFFFKADAVLKSEDGTSVKLTDCFGSFAVAHP